jgi:hypothetical protein
MLSAIKKLKKQRLSAYNRGGGKGIYAKQGRAHSVVFRNVCFEYNCHITCDILTRCLMKLSTVRQSRQHHAQRKISMIIYSSNDDLQ